jgi:CHASE2 domain-containing sensor protein
LDQTRSSPAAASRWRRLAPALVDLGGNVAACVLLVGLLAWIGVVGWIDAGLRREYQALRGARGGSAQEVMLIGVDDETLAHWGAPPWSWDRHLELLRAIYAGKPRVVAYLEPGSRLIPATAPPAALAASIDRGDLLIPSPTGVVGQPILGLDESSGLTTVVFATEAGPTMTARLVARAGWEVPPAPGGRVPVNFLGAERLPTVPAFRVAAGDIPASTFADKVVVIGLVAQPFASLVPTPIGPLAPAQVHAHALAGIADRVVWTTVPPWGRAVLVFLCSILVLVLVPRLSERGAALALVAGTLLLVALDYAGFASGTLLLGASAPALALFAAAAASGLRERRLLLRTLDEVRRSIKRGTWGGLGASRGVEEDEAFWLRVSELARLYLECRSSIVAELPDGAWHLDFRVITGATLEHVSERRRDIRRGPWRRAQLTLNPVWHDEFMSDQLGVQTLLCPLVAETRLVGFWILNFPKDSVLEVPHLRLVEGLARQIALSIVERRHKVTGPVRLEERLLAPGLLSERVGDLADAVRERGADKRKLMGLVESLPCGVLVATLWGEVRWLNDAMRRVAEKEGCADGLGGPLPELLQQITPLGRDEVHDVLRRLVREMPEIHLVGRPDPKTRRPRHELVLAWLPAPPVGEEGEAGEQLMALVALPTNLGASRFAGRPLPLEPDAVLGSSVQLPWPAVPPLRQTAEVEKVDGGETVPVPRTALRFEAEDLEGDNTEPEPAAADPARQTAPLGSRTARKPADPDALLAEVVDAIHESAAQRAEGHVRVGRRKPTE